MNQDNIQQNIANIINGVGLGGSILHILTPSLFTIHDLNNDSDNDNDNDNDNGGNDDNDNDDNDNDDNDNNDNDNDNNDNDNDNDNDNNNGDNDDDMVPFINPMLTFEANDLKSFTLKDIPMQTTNEYRAIATGIILKKISRNIEAYWFDSTEKIIANNGNSNPADISSFIVQTITEAMFNVASTLNTIYTEIRDREHINMISSSIQEWINYMEYTADSYHLNMVNIKDLRTLVYWVIIMVSPIQYINDILKSQMCPAEIFSCTFLKRQLLNSNLIFMSLYSSDIVNTIISRIGIDAYTDLLNDKMVLREANINYELTYYEIASYTGCLYNTIAYQINIDKVSNNINLLELLFKSLSDSYSYIRNSNSNIIIDIDYEHISNNIMLDFTPKVLAHLKNQRYKTSEEFGVCAINYLFNKINIANQSKWKCLSKISYAIYDDINFISNICINNMYPYEIILNLINFKKEDYILMNNDSLSKCIEYTKVIIVNFLNNPDIENVFNNIENVAITNNVFDLKYYKNNLSDGDLKDVSKMDALSIVSILDKHIKNGTNYYDRILQDTENIKDEQYFKILNTFIHSNNGLIRFIPVFEIFINYYLERFNKICFDMEILYFQYFKTNFICDFTQVSSIENISEIIFNMQDDTQKTRFAQNLITLICEHDNQLNSKADNFVIKYYLEIAKNITYDTFVHLITVSVCRQLLIKSCIIPTSVKFGDNLTNYNRILCILDKMEENDYTILDSEEYKTNNCIHIIKCMQNIHNRNIFDKFIKLFNITEEFIDLYDIKDIYIYGILELDQNEENLRYFLGHFGKLYKANNIDLDKFIALNTMNSVYIIIQLIKNGEVSEDNFNKIFGSPLMSLISNYEIEFYSNAISNNHYSQETIVKILQKYIDIDLEIIEIAELDRILKLKDNELSHYIMNSGITINSDMTLINLINYYHGKHIDAYEINSFLISTYSDKFIDYDKVDINKKIEIIKIYHEHIENRIPNILLSKINHTSMLTEMDLTNIGELSRNYNILIPEVILEKYPELINYLTSLNDTDKKILDGCIDNYEIFLKIIDYKIKSNVVFTYLKTILRNDVEMYLELITGYGIFNNDDIALIINNISNDSIALNKILNNETSLHKILGTDKKRIAFLIDKNGNYAISNLSESMILEYIDYYSLDDLIRNNEYGVARLLAFLTSKNIIIKIIDNFGLNKLINIYDLHNLNIYNRMIKYGITENLPTSYLCDNKNIFNILPIIETNTLEIIFTKLDSEYLNNILNMRDHDNNNISYYLARYHPTLFKRLFNENKLNFNANFNSETFIMTLIRNSVDFDMESIIEWIMGGGNSTFVPSDYYYDNSSGSVITYCLKYNNNLVKHFLTSEIINHCICVYDDFEMICPYSDFASSGKVKMNLLQIAAIQNYEALNKIIKMCKNKSNILLKERVNTPGFSHDILHVALFNNPDSVQVLLGLSMFDVAALRKTEEEIGGFEKVIDVQPGSWYYLQNSSKYQLSLNTDEHYYGYNYRQKFKKNNIKDITHYILGRQTIPAIPRNNKRDVCDICDTYTKKIVFTKCRHRVCIVCSLRSDRCGTCRAKIMDSDKILI